MFGDDVGKVGAELRPGDHCPQSGLYEAVHQEHRPPHKIVVLIGDVFPPCRQCGQAVRFRFLMESTSQPVRARARAAHRRSSC